MLHDIPYLKYQTFWKEVCTCTNIVRAFNSGLIFDCFYIVHVISSHVWEKLIVQSYPTCTSFRFTRFIYEVQSVSATGSETGFRYDACWSSCRTTQSRVRTQRVRSYQRTVDWWAPIYWSLRYRGNTSGCRPGGRYRRLLHPGEGGGLR